MHWTGKLARYTDDGRMIRLEYLKRVGDSEAESRHRVLLGSKVIHKGWSHDSFHVYDNYGKDQAIMNVARKYGTTNPVLIEARINHDPYDEFAWVQGWRFAIADYLAFVEGRSVPGFRPAAGPETDSFEWATLMGMHTSDTSVGNLEYALKILDRYREWLGIAGKDY